MSISLFHKVLLSFRFYYSLLEKHAFLLQVHEVLISTAVDIFFQTCIEYWFSTHAEIFTLIYLALSMKILINLMK